MDFILVFTSPQLILAIFTQSLCCTCLLPLGNLFKRLYLLYFSPSNVVMCWLQSLKKRSGAVKVRVSCWGYRAEVFRGSGWLMCDVLVSGQQWVSSIISYRFTALDSTWPRPISFFLPSLVPSADVRRGSSVVNNASCFSQHGLEPAGKCAGNCDVFASSTAFTHDQANLQRERVAVQWNTAVTQVCPSDLFSVF